MRNVCPFCKSAVPSLGQPCGSCGRQASAAPAIDGRAAAPDNSGWANDDDLGGGLDFSRGGSMGSVSSGSSAYSGGGLSLGDDDDPFADDATDGALELDLPSSHSAHGARSIPAANDSPPSGSVPNLQILAKGQGASAFSTPPRSGEPSLAPPQPSLGPPSAPKLRPPGEPSLPPRSGPQAPPLELAPPPPRPPDPAALIARYPTPPSKVWEAPVYAMKVLWRQLELRQDLTSLRKKRSPDVPLYERALRAHDAKTFTVGLIISIAAFAVASFVFFLPVILRFLRDPD